MNLVFTVVAAPLMGWFITSRPGAISIFLAAQSILFSFQTLSVLLAWMAGERGFGGTAEHGAFGPAPTSWPVRYDEGELMAYGVVNLALIGVGLVIVVGVGHLRARRPSARLAVGADTQRSVRQ